MGIRLCQIVVNLWIKSGNQIVLDCVRFMDKKWESDCVRLW